MSDKQNVEANVNENEQNKIFIKIGKGLCGEPFLGKNGREYREIKVPNEDENDKSPWATFAVGANQVHLDKFSEGRLNVISFKEDAQITLKKDIVTGQDENGNNIYETTETLTSVKVLKERLDGMRKDFKDKNDEKGGDKESVTKKLEDYQKQIDESESKKPDGPSKKQEEPAI